MEEMEEDEEGGDPSNPPQEGRTDMAQHTPQRVSFPIGAKRPR